MDNIQKFLTDNQCTIAMMIIIVALICFYCSCDKEGMENTLNFLPVKELDEGFAKNDTPIQGDYVDPVTRDEGVSPVILAGEEPSDITAEDLLPSAGVDSEFSVAPGAPDLSSKNFLTAGFNIGINTQGTCNKNANRQVRSDPVIPVNLNATPFSQSTNIPDYLRKNLEIGGSC